VKRNCCAQVNKTAPLLAKGEADKKCFSARAKEMQRPNLYISAFVMAPLLVGWLQMKWISATESLALWRWGARTSDAWTWIKNIYIYNITMGRWDIYKNTFNDFRPSPQRERARDKKRNPKKRSFKMSKAEKVSLICLKAQLHLSGETDVCREHQN